MSRIKELFTGKKEAREDAEHWIGISDMMSGLMMIFLFMAVAYMYYVQVERDKIKEIALAYKDTQLAIYENLMEEFQEDLSIWDANVELDTLEITFNNPEVLFEAGSSELSGQFRDILDNFFPRYVSILKKYQDDINEIRIEGHTSSDWGSLHGEQAYFPNMQLSQDRTRTTLEYVISLLEDEQIREWVRSSFAAVGYSSSRKILDEETLLEDPSRSRRVNFRVLPNSELQIRTIIEQLRE